MIGGATGNFARQAIKNITGAQEGYSISSFVFETSLGGLMGKFPGAKIPGITTGQGSYKQIYNQMMTKLNRGLINNVSSQTSGKMFVGRGLDTGLFGGVFFAPVMNNLISSFSTESSFLRIDYIVHPTTIDNYYNIDNFIDYIYGGGRNSGSGGFNIYFGGTGNF